MSQQTDNLEQYLAKLGKAHQNGIFNSDAGQYPWQNAGRDGSHLTIRRLAWVRVAVPIAAAAAVAVLFVGPALWNSPASHEVAMNVLAHDVAVKAAAPVFTGSAPTTVEAVSCDYNGDGAIDGKDIQAFVDRIQDSDGDPILQAEYLQRCLLSGGK